MSVEEKLDKLKKDFKQGKEMTFVGFWGNVDDTKAERSFSNFHDAVFKTEVVVDLATGKKEEVTFGSSEQYFMYLKALHFGDNDVLKTIVKGGRTAYEYKKLGRKVKGYNDEEWDRVRYDAMLESLRLKFSNNPTLKGYLLGTGNALLVEASPFDKVWGVGLGKRDKNKRVTHEWRNPLKWRGSNLLGFALMDVRDELKNK